MLLLLVGLHGSFLAAVLLRLRPHPVAGGAGASEPSPARSRLALLIHGAGLAALYLALGLAIATGAGPQRVSVGGIVGVVSAATAVGLVAWSFVVFDSWRLAPRLDPGHQLCTNGPFALVRHPIYVGVDLLAVGSALMVPEPIVLAAAVLLLVGGDLRARAEERVLVEAFGDRYREYMRRVRRFLPVIY